MDDEPKLDLTSFAFAVGERTLTFPQLVNDKSALKRVMLDVPIDGLIRLANVALEEARRRLPDEQ